MVVPDNRRARFRIRTKLVSRLCLFCATRRSRRANSWLGRPHSIPVKDMRFGSHDSPGQQGIQVHGQVVDGRAAGFGDVFRARALLGIEEGCGVADFYALFAADFDDAMAGGYGGDYGIEFAIDADLGAFGRSAWPAIRVAYGQGGHPDFVFGDVCAVVAGAVALAEFLHVDHASFEAEGRAKIHYAGVAQFVFGIDAVDGHAGADHIEESVGMLEEREAGGGVFFAENDAFLFERAARLLEAADLFLV